jgi:hypothetical protein
MHHNRNQSIIKAEKVTQKKKKNKIKTTHHQIQCHYHIGGQS